MSYARNIIAASVTWQAVCEAEDADGAKEHIDYNYSDDLQSALCVLSIGDMSDDRVSSGGFEGSGTVIADFHIPIPMAEQVSGIATTEYALNQLDAIREEIKVLTRNANTTNGYLSIRSITGGESGRLDPDDDNGRIFYVEEMIFEHHL